MRWSGNWDRGRGGIKSVVTQIAEDEFQQSEINKDLEAYKEIRQNLKPEFLIENLARFNIEAKDYKSFTVKDGSYRIAVGKRNMNVSDFLTKHVGLTWDESKNILKDSYLKQLSFETEKEEENCIIFKPAMKYAGDYTMQDSIKVFNYLLRREALEMSSAEQLKKLKSLLPNEDNEILPKYEAVSFKDAYEQEKRAREILKNSTLQEFKFSDLVAIKNEKKKQVDYKLESGKTVFTDHGDRIKFADKQPSSSAVLSGIKMAAEKFGSVKLNGTKEFKESVLREAAQNNVKVIFEPKVLNDQFIAMKEKLANKNENEIARMFEPNLNLKEKTDLTTKSVDELENDSFKRLEKIQNLRSTHGYQQNVDLKFEAKNEYEQLKENITQLSKLTSENPFDETQSLSSKILHNEFKNAQNARQQEQQESNQHQAVQVEVEAKQVKEFQQAEQIDNSSQDISDMYADYEQYSQSEVSTAKTPIEKTKAEKPKAEVETNSSSEIDSTASESNMSVDQYPKIFVEKINEIKDLYNEWQNDKRFTKRVNMATAQAGKLAHNFKALGINTNPFEGMERVADGFKKGLSEAEKPELKDNQVRIGYQIKGDGLQITHNDKPLQNSGVSDEFIEKLRGQDKFLNNFSKEQIKGGILLLGELKPDALPRELHVEKNGDAIKQEEQAVVAKKGMSM
ncbi:hypothetical protein CAY62_21335 (plasmid) [Photobacterium damselae subsp. damselae]|nr:hypothetical protein CAY62_21335 [Photobacterium damselae subsp. damselae]